MQDDHDPVPEVAEPQLTSRAWARMGLTLAVAIVLAAVGADGWSPLAWVGGAGLLASLTVLSKGYWRPHILRQRVGILSRCVHHADPRACNLQQEIFRNVGQVRYQDIVALVAKFLKAASDVDCPGALSCW